MADAERVRLHITPFSPDLLNRYIPPALIPQATNISFHTIETFPERGFGYVELPAMEAQKLKKKLNGSTLKGAKVKIEEAKPEKKRKGQELNEDKDEMSRKKVKRDKKEKRRQGQGVIPGYELGEARHVKRGWVDTAGSKKSQKSKDSLEGKKMRFKTEIPANKVNTDLKEKKTKTKDQKEKQNKEAKCGKKAAVVKEFSNTTRPNTTAALRGQRASGYEDGKGWLDADGNVVEVGPSGTRRTRSSRQPTEVQEPILGAEREQESSPELADEESSSESESEEPTDAILSPSEHEDVLDRQLHEAKSNTATNAAAERERQESTPAGDVVTTPETKEVHPLEALFKRRPLTPEPTQISSKPKRPTPINTSFSFFSADGNAEADPMDVESHVPQTPHTKQDLEWRSIRSAAPTPDTAAIGKRFNFSFGSQEPVSDEEGEGPADVDMDVDMPVTTGGSPTNTKGERGEESEFRKWFYDNRGDLNRAWKKRRREERKVVRQRENRRLSRRIA